MSRFRLLLACCFSLSFLFVSDVLADPTMFLPRVRLLAVRRPIPSSMATARFGSLIKWRRYRGR
jgi:hypothetical protein